MDGASVVSAAERSGIKFSAMGKPSGRRKFDTLGFLWKMTVYVVFFFFSLRLASQAL